MNPYASSVSREGGASRHKLQYRILEGKHAICKLAPATPIPDWAEQPAGLVSITRTEVELSIVCPEANIPSDVKAATGWVCFRLEGPFPFTQTGILTSFIGPLSSHAVPIFVVSTFDTDYVLVPEEYVSEASRLLSEAGHELILNDIP